MKSKLNRKQLKQKYIEAGYADKNAKWYWNKEEKAYCLPLKPIVL